MKILSKHIILEMDKILILFNVVKIILNIFDELICFLNL